LGFAPGFLVVVFLPLEKRGSSSPELGNENYYSLLDFYPRVGYYITAKSMLFPRESESHLRVQGFLTLIAISGLACLKAPGLFGLVLRTFFKSTAFPNLQFEGLFLRPTNLSMLSGEIRHSSGSKDGNEGEVLEHISRSLFAFPSHSNQ